MLQRIHKPLRPKIIAILLDLEGHGWQPLIDAGVWRSKSDQLKKVRAGYSKVKFSFHNATTRDGAPDALACDITDARHGWDSPKSFWLMLAASAQSHGLTTGIYWGLNAARRRQLQQVIAGRNFQNRDVSLGWDTAHVQPRGITLLSARLGKRPKFV
jgi:hypothetical protein